MSLYANVYIYLFGDILLDGPWMSDFHFLHHQTHWVYHRSSSNDDALQKHSSISHHDAVYRSDASHDYPLRNNHLHPHQNLVMLHSTSCHGTHICLIHVGPWSASYSFYFYFLSLYSCFSASLLVSASSVVSLKYQATPVNIHILLLLSLLRHCFFALILASWLTLLLHRAGRTMLMNLLHLPFWTALWDAWEFCWISFEAHCLNVSWR